MLLLTARAQEEDIERGFAAGADDYLVKPFSVRELAERADALLARQLTAQAPVQQLMIVAATLSATFPLGSGGVPNCAGRPETSTVKTL